MFVIWLNTVLCRRGFHFPLFMTDKNNEHNKNMNIQTPTIKTKTQTN